MRLGVHVPVGVHELLDHVQQVDHDLLLAIAQGLVLEEEETHGEAVLEVLHLEEPVDRLLEDRREDGEAGPEQLLARSVLERAQQRRRVPPGERGESLGRRRPDR